MKGSKPNEDPSNCEIEPDTRPSEREVHEHETGRQQKADVDRDTGKRNTLPSCSMFYLDKNTVELI